jgi:hypothetical protein
MSLLLPQPHALRVSTLQLERAILHISTDPAARKREIGDCHDRPGRIGSLVRLARLPRWFPPETWETQALSRVPLALFGEPWGVCGGMRWDPSR